MLKTNGRDLLYLDICTCFLSLVKRNSVLIKIDKKYVFWKLINNKKRRKNKFLSLWFMEIGRQNFTVNILLCLKFKYTINFDRLDVYIHVILLIYFKKSCFSFFLCSRTYLCMTACDVLKRYNFYNVCLK